MCLKHDAYPDLINVYSEYKNQKRSIINFHMKRLLTGVMAVALSITAMGQSKVYLSENFDNGIPADFITVDRDENPVATSYYKNVSIGSSWIANVIDNQTNKAAFSFTQGSYNFAQENWLIAPQISIDSDSEAYLRWDGKSVYHDYLEDYKVMVSTSNDDIGSFKELYRVEGESYFWKTHTVSLKQYAGQKIYIAFVCTSLNKYILAIDNIYIGELDGYDFDVKNTSSRFSGNVASATVSGNMRNIGRTADIKSVSCTIGGTVLSEDVDVSGLTPGDVLDYKFDIPLTANSVNRYDISLRMADGTEQKIYTDSVISSYFPRTLLLEEVTGGWCPNCPEGILYLNEVKERMGKDVIVVSVHMNPDPLQCEGYSSSMVSWLSSLPSIIYNRNLDYKNSDMYHTAGYLEKAMLEPTTAMVTATAALDGNNVNMHADISFAADYDNSSDKYRVGFAVVDKEYSQGKVIQKNSCTLVSSGEYYYLPQEIPGTFIKFHDLPIEGSTMLSGVPNSLPAEIKAGGEYSLDYQLTLPDRVYGIDSLCVVTTVFDSRTGVVLNAASTDLVVDATSGINAVDSNTLNAQIICSDNGEVCVILPCTESCTARIVSLDGCVVKEVSANGSDRLNINCRSLDGCYIVQVIQNGRKTVKKIIL